MQCDEMIWQVIKRLQKDELIIVVAHEGNDPVLAVHPNVDLTDIDAIQN